jgi:NAD(P)-dependent dehydrogenase (short-subunit alcohol dehydrogenase family)
LTGCEGLSLASPQNRKIMSTFFQEKVAIVTGGSFGIGRATAIAFARKGCRVAVVDVVEDRETTDTIKSEGGEVIFIRSDMGIASDIEAMVSRVMSEWGRLDFAFNNAGIEGIGGDTVACTEENWDRTLNVNLKGVWLCMKYQIPAMLKSGGGSIVNCASIAGLVGFPGLPAYVASKHALVGLTKTTALEYVRQGIRVNAVCPGVIRTPMIDRFTGKQKEAEKAFEEQEPIGRMGEPEEVATAVLWLCSEESSFVVGHAMAVDGGWVAK